MELSEAERLERIWETNPRWAGITRPYSGKDVLRLRGSVKIDYTLATLGAEKFWKYMKEEKLVRALGAIGGNQAIQQITAGLKSIYLSGWQTASSSNSANEMYPDQSLYPVNSVPDRVREINKALIRADQIHHMKDDHSIDWLQPIVADAEAGFGGVLNAYELMKAMIEAGASAVHYEDQLSSEKRCGHLAGKCLIPAKSFIKTLVSARLAADVMGIPTVIIARTDADSASYITNDSDENDLPFIDKANRTEDGFYPLIGKPIDRCIARGLAYAPYADLLWMETSNPSLEQAQAFADGVHAKFPGKLLSYNCSPSFNWRKNLSDDEIAVFQEKIAAMGYKFQFVTLAGFHSLNEGMFKLAKEYSEEGMSAYVRVQEREFDMEKNKGFEAVKHQSFVGTGYFDDVRQTIDGDRSMSALDKSTENAQFH